MAQVDLKESKVSKGRKVLKAHRELQVLKA
jgi:hypothetical protein